MNEGLSQALSPDEAILWQDYLSAEEQGHRTRALTILKEFVAALQGHIDERRHHFAEKFCRQMANKGEMMPLRQPLFAAIIGPFLVSAHEKGHEDAANWLAYFYPRFLNIPSSQRLYELPRQSPINLLHVAFRRDPDNIQTQELLIQHLARQFAYAVHKVPSGLLYGADGTTIAECQEWVTDLSLFCEVVRRRNETEKYQEAIRYWGFHFHGYADYLTYRDQYSSCADHINRHWTA